MRYIYVIVFLAVTLLSCKNDTNKQNSSAEAGNSTDIAVEKGQSVINQDVVSYPSITEDIVKDLGLRCDYIDYIFYDLPISISQNDKSAIFSNLSFISKEAPESIPASCKAMGRKSFQANGEIIIEADVYLNVQESCYFYVFYENGKKAYANNMTKDGINFYYNVFGQAGVKK